ncbi:hypothetical protein M101_4760 [Bacteroides fragilis str. 1007-1-F |nr:hypothetical protein M101_4760 [Bacteroides fragilis str. 1007-1-F \
MSRLKDFVSSSNLVVNSLFLFFQVDYCPFCFNKKKQTSAE